MGFHELSIVDWEESTKKNKVWGKGKIKTSHLQVKNDISVCPKSEVAIAEWWAFTSEEQSESYAAWNSQT